MGDPRFHRGQPFKNGETKRGGEQTFNAPRHSWEHLLTIWWNTTFSRTPSGLSWPKGQVCTPRLDDRAPPPSAPQSAPQLLHSPTPLRGASGPHSGLSFTGHASLGLTQLPPCRSKITSNARGLSDQLLNDPKDFVWLPEARGSLRGVGWVPLTIRRPGTLQWIMGTEYWGSGPSWDTQKQEPRGPFRAFYSSY